MDYENPIVQTYVLEKATLSTAAELGGFAGPAGKTGRIESISVAVTTATTVAATVVSVGDGTDVDKYGTLSVPIASADAVANASVSLTTDDNLIPADSFVAVDTDGGCTAGAGTITVIVAWF